MTARRALHVDGEDEEMTERYRILFEGRLQPGIRAEDAAARLVELFGMAEDQARRLVAGDRPRVVKRDLEARQAERYREALTGAGLVVRMEPMGAVTPAQAATVVAPAGQGGRDRAGHEPEPSTAAQPERGWQPSSAVYAARVGEGTPGPGGAEGTWEGLGTPVAGALAAGRGAGWIGAGFGYFGRSVGGWLLAMLVFVVIAVLVSLVPLIGNLAMTLLWPIFTAGFMLGARDQDRGEAFRVQHLFQGFQTNAGQLALVGLIYMGLGILLTVLVLGLIFALVGPLSLGPGPVLDELTQADPAAAAFGLGVGLTVLILTLLMIPLTMLILFAPALVALDGLPAWTAMKTSFRGCLRNIVPFLIFGLLALLLLVLAMIPAGLGLLVVGPALTAAIYVAWREIYHGGVAPGT